MKPRYSIIVALVLFISNCTHVRKYSSFDDINTVTMDKKAQLTLSNGQILVVSGFQITADSSFWLHPTAGNKQSVSTSEVKSVVIKKSGRGALEGLGLGLVIGFGTGALMGFASGDDPEDQFFAFTAEAKALILGIFFGGTGGLLGLPIGAAVGSKDRFIIAGEK